MAASSNEAQTTTQFSPPNLLLALGRFASPPRRPSPPPFPALETRLGELWATVSRHPFLQPLLSFHEHLQSFSQARCRMVRSTAPLSAHGFAAALPGDSVAGLVVANGIANFLNLYNTVLVVRLVLTWFPNAPPAIVSPLSTICDPYLNIFRGIIPPLGTLDLSPILAFLVLNFFTSSAAALPAELPATGAALQQNAGPHFMQLGYTASQLKWMRRMSSKKPEEPAEAI